MEVVTKKNLLEIFQTDMENMEYLIKNDELLAYYTVRKHLDYVFDSYFAQFMKDIKE